MSAATGKISTVAGAGDGLAGSRGDGGPATSAEVNLPQGVAVDSSGNLFIADTGNSEVREVSAATGTITTIAGNGVAGSLGNGGPATSAELNAPAGVAVDSSGNVFIADGNNNELREVKPAAQARSPSLRAPALSALAATAGRRPPPSSTSRPASRSRRPATCTSPIGSTA